MKKTGETDMPPKEGLPPAHSRAEGGLRAKAAGIRIDHFSGTEGLTFLAETWGQITRDPASAHFYQSWDWYSCWLKWLEADPRQFHFFLFRRDTSPLAIFPLREAVLSLGGIKLKALSPPAHDHFLLADVVCTSEALDIPLWQLLWEYLNEAVGGYDVIAMHRLLPDGNAARLLSSFPPALVQKRLEAGCDYIFTGEKDFAAYLAGLSKNFRRSLKRARKELTSAYPDRYGFTFTEDQTNLPPKLEAFFQIEASGWKGAAGSAISLDPGLTNFYRELVLAFTRRGKAMVAGMEIAEKAVAGQISLASASEVYLLKVGYDEKYKEVAPGKLLMEELVKKCFADPAICRINLITDDSWHDDWEIERIPKVRYYLFNETIRGRVAFFVLKIYGTLIRRLLPSWLKRRLIPGVASS